ncbi:hypothetical protein OF83DRAFT_451111 [Amylostereum chailletii]|nr:hypothetical protein OF83DRAFT_451111 [Amylostereum chailletii]
MKARFNVSSVSFRPPAPSPYLLLDRPGLSDPSRASHLSHPSLSPTTMASVPIPSPSPSHFVPVVSPSPSDTTVVQQRTTLAGSEPDFAMSSEPSSRRSPPSSPQTLPQHPEPMVVDSPPTTPSQPSSSTHMKRKADDSSSVAWKRHKSPPAPSPRAPNNQDILHLFWRNGNRLSRDHFCVSFAPYLCPVSGPSVRTVVEPILMQLVNLVDADDVFLHREYRIVQLKGERYSRPHPLQKVWTAGTPLSAQAVPLAPMFPFFKPSREERRRDTGSLLRDMAREKKAIFDAKELAKKKLLNPKPARRTSRKPSPPAAVAQNTAAPAEASWAHLYRARQKISIKHHEVSEYFRELDSLVVAKALARFIDMVNPAP